MPEIKKGSITFDFKLVKLGAELTEDDRQCAWELYTEIVTRAAVVGKHADGSCEDFSGEIYINSFQSLYLFFQECRSIMRRFPVGKLNEPDQEHLGVLIHRVLSQILRPFLEKWQGRFQAWWQKNYSETADPMEVQGQFPDGKQMLRDWRDLRRVMREVGKRICRTYKLVPVDRAEEVTKIV